MLLELTQISIPSYIVSIGDNAFNSCSKLMQISIPSSIKSFGRRVFYKCENLNINNNNEKRIELFENKYLLYKSNAENSTFDTLIWTNPNVCTLTIPSFIEIIGIGAFECFNSLTQITIPSSVKSIEDYSFYGCSSLTQISIQSSLTSAQ